MYVFFSFFQKIRFIHKSYVNLSSIQTLDYIRCRFSNGNRTGGVDMKTLPGDTGFADVNILVLLVLGVGVSSVYIRTMGQDSLLNFDLFLRAYLVELIFRLV